MKKNKKIIITGLILTISIISLYIFFNLFNAKIANERRVELSTLYIENIQKELNDLRIEEASLDYEINNYNENYYLSLNIKSNEFDYIQFKDLYGIVYNLKNKKDYIEEELDLSVTILSDTHEFDIEELDKDNGYLIVSGLIVYFNDTNSEVSESDLVSSWESSKKGNILDYTQSNDEGDSYTFYSDRDLYYINSIDDLTTGRWYITSNNNLCIRLNNQTKYYKVFLSKYSKNKMYLLDETNGDYFILEKSGESF